TQQRNRLHALVQSPYADPSVVQRLQQHLDFLNQQVAALTTEIEALLGSDHPWPPAATRFRTVPCLGLIIAAWILVATHAFARCETAEQAASYAGLAPHARDSGSSLQGRRSVGHRGHTALRNVLYMASASAVRFNPVLQPVYQRHL